MTIPEIIEITDRLTPNAYPDGDKTRWLQMLDRTMLLDLELPPDHPLLSRGSDVTLVPEPYAEDVYVPFLQARMAFFDEDMERYNLAIARYNDGWLRFARRIHAETRLPRQAPWRF